MSNREKRHTTPVDRGFLEKEGLGWGKKGPFMKENEMGSAIPVPTQAGLAFQEGGASSVTPVRRGYEKEGKPTSIHRALQRHGKRPTKEENCLPSLRSSAQGKGRLEAEKPGPPGAKGRA